jgi:signal transduction histidine kinase
VLERNLHDGAQQRLVALTFELRRARTRATGEEAERLDRALDMAAQALAELRDLAHGIFPAILPEAGLEAALELVATAAPVPVRIRSSGLGGALRPDVEMAAYRVVAEALEASGDGVEISVERSAEAVRLVIRIEDPGDPGVDSGHDAADRVGAIGGTVAKRREAHMRTTEVLLPCVS